MAEYAITFSVPQLDFKKNLILGTQVTLIEIEGYFRKQMDLPEILEFHRDREFHDPPLEKSKTVASYFYNATDPGTGNMVYIRLDYQMPQPQMQHSNHVQSTLEQILQKRDHAEPQKGSSSSAKKDPSHSHNTNVQSQHDATYEKNKTGIQNTESNKSSLNKTDTQKSSQRGNSPTLSSKQVEGLPEIKLNSTQTLFSPPKQSQMLSTFPLSQPNPDLYSIFQKNKDNVYDINKLVEHFSNSQIPIITESQQLPSTSIDVEKEKKKKKKKEKEKETEKEKESSTLSTLEMETDYFTKSEKKKKKKKDKEKEAEKEKEKDKEKTKVKEKKKTEELVQILFSQRKSDTQELEEIKKKVKLSKHQSSDTNASVATEITTNKSEGKDQLEPSLEKIEEELSDISYQLFDELDGKVFVTILNPYLATNNHFNVDPKMKLGDRIEAYKERFGLRGAEIGLTLDGKNKFFNFDRTIEEISSADEIKFEVQLL